MSAKEIRPFQIEAAKVDDAWALAEMHVAAWREAYVDIVPKAYLDALDTVKRAANWARTFSSDRPDGETFLCKSDGKILGFVDVGQQRSADIEADGEVTAIYIRKAYYGTGLARVLADEGVRAMLDFGFSSASLWVLEDNIRARRFYEKLGGRPLKLRQILDMAGKDIPEMPYIFEDLPRLLQRRL